MVTGMSCAACVARVEKAVLKVEGVKECSVSLLTNSMGVEGSADPKKIIEAVEKAGYGAALFGAEKKSGTSSEKGGAISNVSESLIDKETPLLVKRLASSGALLLVLMYVSMGNSMWNFPLPHWFDGNFLAKALLQLLLSISILLINRKFFVSGLKSALHASPNMDTLVAMGSGVSFLYSVVILFLMTDAVQNGTNVHSLYHSLYFETASMIVTLITLGKLLESVSKGRTTNALKSLMKLAPKTAVVIKNGREVEIPIEELQKDDVFVVKPGDNIPADGIVVEGNSSVNEAALTGESLPVYKQIGDNVTSATLNTNGFLKCRALRVGNDTTLAQIIQLVSDSAATKAPIAKIADKVSGIFVPSVLLISLITFVAWLILGKEFEFALARAISVLVVSCPCALGLATPVAIMVASGVGAKNGVLFKTSESLELTGRIKVVALDKTGTITKGEPVVTDVFVLEASSEKELLELALNLESKSEHPLAKAILKKCKENQLEPHEVSDFVAVAGRGIKAKISGNEIFCGNPEFIFDEVSNGSASPEIQKAALSRCEEFACAGKTPLLFAVRNAGGFAVSGIIAVADVIKEDSAYAISELKKLGIKTVMLTGDNVTTAKTIAAQAGVDEVVAGVLPEGKLKEINKLKLLGKTAMIGDGINDAPALAAADLGIAIGAGADVAIDSADVVLMKSRLSDVVSAIKLGRKTLRNIHENLFWAFFYNIALIPVAAGLYFRFNIAMNPMFGAAAMSLSSFCVVSNALRLNLFGLKHKTENSYSENKIEEKTLKKEKTMEKTLKVEGMMCTHCEAHVKKALESIDGIIEATPSHEKGEVLIKMSKDVSDDSIGKAVADAGYKVVG